MPDAQTLTDSLVLPLLLCACLTVLGYLLGLRRGKAVGWLDKYFADVAQDHARRERNGQFKVKGSQ